MNPTGEAILDHSQIFPQGDPSNPISSIRLAAKNSRMSIVNLLRKIENNAKIALGFLGVDARFFSKFIHNLRGAVRPACIAAVSCFVALHLFPSLGISAIVGIVFFVHLAVSRARLEMMKEDLEAAKQAGTEIESGTRQMVEQNAELRRLNLEQKTTIDAQGTTIAEAQRNLEEMQNNLSAAQENLVQEQRIKEEQDQLIAQQQVQLQMQQTYINQCQSCLASVFTSQQELIQGLQQRLESQTATVREILQNVQNIANGEQKLTEALNWAQGRIAEAQAKLTAVIDISADITDPEKCRQLIENGQFAQKAQAMQQAAQNAYNKMNELNAGLTTRIIEAQRAIAVSRKRAEDQLGVLMSQQRETSHKLEQANGQIKQKEQEIARLKEKQQTESKHNAGRIQALEAEITREKQSLETLTLEKGTLEQNLEKTEVQLGTLQGDLHSLALTNETLRIQCQMQEQTMEEQRETIESQRQSLAALNDNLHSLQGQLRQGPGIWRTFVTAAGLAVGAVATKAILPG
ncbi:MAG: hypothetical protein LBF49_00950 [Puniceicoccales bacterium]|jgi:chromosome segregation ATPase|nr:hypothetical protein [Puniceicoccales bacterium]